MKYRIFLLALIAVLSAEIATLVLFARKNADGEQSPVTVNEAVQSVQADWNRIEAHQNRTNLDYTVLNQNGEVIFKTAANLSQNINEAIRHRDTILDIEIDGTVSGKIIIYNDSPDTISGSRQKATAVFVTAIILQCGICILYLVYLNHIIIHPFRRLNGFAERVAAGNLDVPLNMDRGNIFGAFTESFDIMRAELKRAQAAEARANASKKELVAKLSHDIRTPVASIKAAAELGTALTKNPKTQQNYTRILHKADQINTLVTNLFSATLEELQHLTVCPVDIKSTELLEMLKHADYFDYARIPSVPNCLIFADKLRLQQVFDNIFANSYKYANTEIDVNLSIENNCLAVKIEDHGGGVPEEELPLLKEKFGRGKNSKTVDGAGLGLYISNCFMEEMQGALVIENGRHGLSVTVLIALSGSI